MKLPTIMLILYISLQASCYACDASLTAAIHGTVMSSDGERGQLDRLITIVDGIEQDCSFFVERSTYSCYERGDGTYTLKAFQGEKEWEWTFDLESDDCHVIAKEWNIVLD